MSIEDALRWDARYDGHAVVEPSPPDGLECPQLNEEVPTGGRALDVACGAGAQSAWLAQRGLDVVACDAASKAIELTQAAAKRAGVADRVDARVVDLDAGLPREWGSFDVIVCQRFRATGLYDAFVQRLRAGGTCIVTVLSQTGAEAPGRFHAPAGELLAAFARPNTSVVHHVEANGQESIVVRAT